MKRLDRQTSKEILSKLLALFNHFDEEAIDKYLDSKPFLLGVRSFNFGSFDRHPLPFLFWDEKEIKQQYDNMLYFSTYAQGEDGKYYTVWKFGLFKKFAEYLKNNYVNKFYGAGNWCSMSEIGHHAIELRPEELDQIGKDNVGIGDIYFFAKDFSWVLAFNHHNLGFLAGSKEFIEGFADYYPEYRKLIPESGCPCCR